jgi:hypothetical protein
MGSDRVVGIAGGVDVFETVEAPKIDRAQSTGPSSRDSFNSGSDFQNEVLRWMLPPSARKSNIQAEINADCLF